MCVFRGDICPTLGERGSDLSSYNISASSDPRSGQVGASEGVRELGERKGESFFQCPLPCLCQCHGPVRGE